MTDTNWLKLAAECRDRVNADDLIAFAKSIGVSVESLTEIRIGQISDRYGKCWTFPERDGAGEVIGIVKRTAEGKKIAMKGSHRGLTMSYPMDRYAGTLSDEPIVVVEGASDAAAAISLGIIAVGRPAASSGFKHLQELLADRHVVVFGENDQAGRDGAEKIATGLVKSCASMRIVFPPNDIKDLRSWKNAPTGCDKAEVLAAIRSAEYFKPDAKPKKAGIVKLLSDAILADQHFSRDAGEKLYRFSEGVYVAKAERFIRQRVKRLLVDANGSRKWSVHLANEVVAFIAVDAPQLWERPPLDILNVQNGLLNVRTRELKPHTSEHLSSIRSPVRFDPDATCPAWDMFIGEVFPSDAIVVAFELIAWLMAPLTSIQRAALLVGEGCNGKSTYLAGVSQFIGSKNIAGLSLHRLESDRFSAARLMGKLANICPDLPSDHLAGTSMFKALTGNDIVLAEHKFKDTFEFTPYARLIFSANHLPQSQDSSQAFFRRWLVIPFGRTFEPSEQIPRADLDSRLADPRELSGVLNKALDALVGLRDRNAFTESASMIQAAAEFRQTTDPLSVWFDQNTTEHPELVTAKGDLVVAYNRDSEKHGRPPMSGKAFGLAIRRLKPHLQDAQRTIHGRLQWTWLGLGIRRRDADPTSLDSLDSLDFPYIKSPTNRTTSLVERNEVSNEVSEDFKIGKPRESSESREVAKHNGLTREARELLDAIRQSGPDGVSWQFLSSNGYDSEPFRMGWSELTLTQRVRSTGHDGCVIATTEETNY